MAEHDEFMDDLLKALKREEDADNKDPPESDHENEKYPIHDPSTHWKLKKPMVGERFESPKQFKECVTYYALANGYSIWFEVSSNKKMIPRCGIRPEKVADQSKGKQKKTERYPKKKTDDKDLCTCPWRCYARWMRKEASFQVISLKDVHTCSRKFKYGSLINYKWIGKEFGPKIRLNPDIKLVELADLVMKKYKCSITPNQCKRAKIWALNVYEKSLVEHYGMLRSYGDELLRSNPGSTVKLGVTTNPDDKVYFDRFYVCLHGLKEGWKKGCRRIIALDGCFLKTVCQGKLLTAIGRDGNNHIFPIAWAVVNVENKDNWEWFIRLPGEDLDIRDGQGLTLMSDQHKGLLEAVKQVMPYAEHRQCARHIYENFRKLYSGVEFRNLFWKASKASYPLEFERIMHEMKTANPGAYDYLINKEPKTWSRAFFGFMCCCEAVENGFSECFNVVLVKVRTKPIITMLEAIRVILMERMEKIRKICDSWNFDICPLIIKKLESAKASQRYWNVIPGGGSKFEVRQGHDAFTIDEENNTCTCRIWQLSGLPCAHAVAAIYYIHKNPDDYVPCWFRKEMYKATYGYPLQPVQGMNQWPANALNKPLPPKPRIMPGRPRKKRKRSIHEPASHVGRVSRIGSIMTCQKCFKLGHNKKGCKEVERQIPSRPSSKPSGRPKNVTKTREGPSTISREGSSSLRPEKVASVEKQTGGAPSVDKGKGKAVDQGNKKEANASAPTIGGFMTDARKSNKNTSQSYLMPIRRQAQHRINTLNMQRKIKGPGSSSKDAMLLN